MTEMISVRDRESMLKVVRMNERVAKAATKQRSAELLADFEKKLASEFRYDDDVVWKQLAEEIQAAITAADAKVAERCRELGIPDEFRPGLSGGWHRRGQNAVRERRVELRKVAVTKIAALEARAKLEIERRSAEAQTALIAGGLQSVEAREAMLTLPKPVDLMPLIELGELGAGVDQIGALS